jgi:hypothetical protein
VREQIANRQLACDRGILELKPRQVFDDGIVPVEQFVVDQHADERRGHRLGGRSDREQRVAVDGGRLTEPGARRIRAR